VPLALAPLDWIGVAVLLISLLVGAWRGLVVEVMSLVSWIAAFILAQWFAPDAAVMLPMGQSAEAARYAAGFVLVFVATLFAGALIGSVWCAARCGADTGRHPGGGHDACQVLAHLAGIDWRPMGDLSTGHVEARAATSVRKIFTY
jgi:Colicin V production protein